MRNFSEPAAQGGLVVAMSTFRFLSSFISLIGQLAEMRTSIPALTSPYAPKTIGCTSPRARKRHRRGPEPEAGSVNGRVFGDIFHAPEGPAKKPRRTPPVHLLNSRPTHPPADFLPPLPFFQYVFGRFSARSSKTPQTNIFAKSPCRKLFPKKSTTPSMSVFPRFFWFYRLLGCFAAMGVQKHHKKCFTKNHFRKVFTKIDKKSKTDGRLREDAKNMSVRQGSLKTPSNIKKNRIANKE
jgi:hypothetical protein